MTIRENQIYELIKKNPMISQKEIAEILGIKRSSVGVHILNLSKKGAIAGKGYVLTEEPYVYIIGGTNMDINGIPLLSLNINDSVPGRVKISPGGVGRNIAENLARIGIPTKLLSVVGQDHYGKYVIEDALDAGIQCEDMIQIDTCPTSVYLSVTNEEGALQYAISDMKSIDYLTPSEIDMKKNSMRGSKVIVIDANLREDTLYQIFTLGESNPIFVDPVSVSKSVKIRPYLDKIHTLKPNAQEAEVLTGIKIHSIKDAKKATLALISKGVKNVFLSMGAEGFVYGDHEKINHFKTTQVQVINPNGAGDAFMAGLIYGYYMGESIEKMAIMGHEMAKLALKSETTVNKSLNKEKIHTLMEEKND